MILNTFQCDEVGVVTENTELKDFSFHSACGFENDDNASSRIEIWSIDRQ